MITQSKSEPHDAWQWQANGGKNRLRYIIVPLPPINLLQDSVYSPNFSHFRSDAIEYENVIIQQLPEEECVTMWPSNAKPNQLNVTITMHDQGSQE